MPILPAATAFATAPRDYEKELADLLDVAKAHNSLISLEPDVMVAAEQMPSVRWVSSLSEEQPYAHA